MMKAFTLVGRDQQRISKSEGKVIFHLVDENGDKRALLAIAKLDENNKVIDVKAAVPREDSLLHCLLYADINETIYDRRGAAYLAESD